MWRSLEQCFLTVAGSQTWNTRFWNQTFAVSQQPATHSSHWRHIAACLDFDFIAVKVQQRPGLQHFDLICGVFSLCKLQRKRINNYAPRVQPVNTRGRFLCHKSITLTLLVTLFLQKEAAWTQVPFLHLKMRVGERLKDVSVINQGLQPRWRQR